jgi:hypothetical protein
MNKNILATTIALSAISMAADVNAADIRWNGFASMAGGISTSDAKRADGEELHLYGYDDDFNFRPNSKIALQASSDLGDGLSVTAQVVARGADDFNVDMEWAFLSYDVGDASRINIGKLRIPFYQYSDFLDVGYAYPWIQPPESVYDLFFSTMEGANLQLNSTIGTWDSNLQLVLGRTTDDLVIATVDTTANLKNLMGGAWSINNDWLTLRAAYFQADTTLENSQLNSIEDGLINTGFAKQGNDFAVREDKGSFVGVGFKIEKASWLFAGEVTQIKVADSFIADQDSAYITIGKTFNDLMLHVTYEQQENSRTEGITDGVPFPTGTGLDLLVGGANLVADDLESENSTVTIGVRYNFHPSSVFKIEYSQREFDTDATQTVDGSASLVRFSIDTMF